MSTDISETVIPRMGAEGGYGVDDTVAPLRVSGFLSLILGVLSVAALVGPAMLILPILSIAFGIYALRRHGELVPVGIGAAKVGLVLAFGFGSCGFFIPWMKTATLGNQAEKFARDYIEVIANGELELALELRKQRVNRFPATMPLKAHYAVNESSEEMLVEFGQESINKLIQQRGPGAEWKLERQVRVYSHFRQQKAHLIFIDPSGKDPVRLSIYLEYEVDHRNGDGQWHVDLAQQYSERIVAPVVL